MATLEVNTCFCQICHKIRETIRKTFQVFENYGWLLDSYIVDFYEDDLWKKLPSSWKDFLETTTPDELGLWILNESPRDHHHDHHRHHRVWPLSLQSLRRVVELLQIERDPNREIILACENKMMNENGTIIRKRDLNECSKHPKLRNLFGKNVKPKKKHEIDVMAQIIADCASSTNSECAADVGAGMGHLARTLAYKYEMCVTCVEQQTQLSVQARKLDAEFESKALKYLPNFLGQKPEHVSLKIERNSLGSSQFVERINNEFKEKFRLNQEYSGFGLIGLHPCGDLATTLLECYAESDCAKFICIAGCCYMKMTVGEEAGALRSYPMSEYLRSRKPNDLSYAALEVSCHAVENHCQKLKSAEYCDLKVHAYRAALETLLVEKDASLRHGKLMSVKLKENMTFKELVIEISMKLKFVTLTRGDIRYCIAATENLGEENRPKFVEEFENPRIMKFLEQWEKVVIFGSLRLMLAPLVESVVLLDRFLYLSEKNLSPKLKAVFDPVISPRNFLLTSVK